MSEQVEELLDQYNELNQIKKEANRKARKARKKIKEVEKDIIDNIGESNFPTEIGLDTLSLKPKTHVRLEKPAKEHRLEFVKRAIANESLGYLDVYRTPIKKVEVDNLENWVKEDLDIYISNHLKVT